MFDNKAVGFKIGLNCYDQFFKQDLHLIGKYTEASLKVYSLKFHVNFIQVQNGFKKIISKILSAK